MQTRLLFPAYYGVGSALEWFSNNYGVELLQEMYKDWPYFTSIVNNLQMVSLKADMHVAENYLELITTNKNEAVEVFDQIRSEYQKTKKVLLQITKTDALLEMLSTTMEAAR